MLSGCHQNNAEAMVGNIGIQYGCCLDVIRLMQDNVGQYRDTVRVLSGCHQNNAGTMLGNIRIQSGCCLDVIRIMQRQWWVISGYSMGAVWMSSE